MAYEDFFIIPIMEIDAAWSVRGFSHDFYAEEYCKAVLNIPSEYIEETLLFDEGLEIKLMDFEEVCDEDWCIQLGRLSRYKDAS